MSTIQRSRSIRKPEIPPPDSAKPQTQARNVSPTRLPTKAAAPSLTARTTSMNPAHRATRTVSGSNNTSGGAPSRTNGTSAATRPPSGGLTRPAAPSAAVTGSTRPPSGGLTRPAAGTAARATRRPAAVSGGETKGGRYYPPSSNSARAGTAGTSTAAQASRPTSASGSSNATGPVKRPSAHTRAKSTTSAATTPSRPPSQEATTRPTARNGHVRTISAGKPASSTATTAATATTATASAGVSQAAPKLRPAFSTLQQHYSPAKSTAPKPSTAAILAPPSPSKLPANVAASAEVARLQTELLQLHLLHRDAAVVDAEWRASAKEKLGGRYEEIALRSKDLENDERVSNEERNLAALKRWGEESGALEEKIQGLDVVMQGVWSLGEKGGKYARLVRRFERWIDGVCEIQEERGASADRTRNGSALSDKILVEELDSSWKEDLPAILRKLEGWQGQLRDMGESPPTSQNGHPKTSVGRILDGAKGMVDGMLSELSMMREIETEALARDASWIEEMIKDDDDDDTPRAGAIWRTV